MIIVLNGLTTLLFWTQTKRIHDFWRPRAFIFLKDNYFFHWTFFSNILKEKLDHVVTFRKFSFFFFFFFFFLICYFTSQNFSFIKDVKENNLSQSLIPLSGHKSWPLGYNLFIDYHLIEWNNKSKILKMK